MTHCEPNAKYSICKLCPYSDYECLSEDNHNIMECIDCSIGFMANEKWQNDIINSSLKKNHKSNRSKKTTKRNRDIKFKNKLIRRQYDKCGWKFLYNEYLSTPNGNGKFIKDSYYRLSKRNLIRFYKTYGNRKVRYYKNDIPKGNYYQKIFDLWWTIY